VPLGYYLAAQSIATGPDDLPNDPESTHFSQAAYQEEQGLESKVQHLRSQTDSAGRNKREYINPRNGHQKTIIEHTETRNMHPKFATIAFKVKEAFERKEKSSMMKTTAILGIFFLPGFLFAVS
jgi:hypothetical protein